MDNFDVLVKHYGINPKGKSAPMASSKKAPKTQNNYGSVHQDPNFFTPSFSKPNCGDGSLFDGQNDDVFGFNLSNKGQSYDVFDDVFQMPAKSSSGSGGGGGGGGGGGFDFDMVTMFKGPGSGSGSGVKAVGVNGGDDIWGFGDKSNGSGGSSSTVGVGNVNGDLLSSDPVDEFWGKMAKLGSERGGNRLEEKKGSGDDLIPGFDMGFGNTFNDRAQTSAKVNNIGVSSLDELENFATRGIGKDSNGHGGSFTSKSEPNFFDFGATVNGGFVQKEKLEKAEMMFQAEGPDLDMFFVAPINRRTPTSEKKDVNTKTYEEPNLFSGAGFGTDKRVSTSAFHDDFSSIFEGSPSSGVFQEIEGESDERRSLRFARYQRAKARMRDAVDEMNQREFKAQQEQEEKYRIADAMEAEMKRWAAGKEGNLRALLSSLQLVLGPEFGWRPVSITDLITSSQVKIAYKKAALCIHPDKVQQRGANLEQKYVAEKAFDLLKEAWNKFSTEELR